MILNQDPQVDQTEGDFKDQNFDQVQNENPTSKEVNEEVPIFDVDQEEIKEVFSINTVYSRIERYTIKDLCHEMDWVENRTETNGSLFWFIDAMNEVQKKFIRKTDAFFNRYPKASVVCNKREFHILIKKYEELFPDAFRFIPQTFVLPDEIKRYRKYLDEHENPFLLAKPSRGRGGDGIFFVKEFKDLDFESMKEYFYVAQEYVPNPFLIEKKKFDFRLYLMIKGVDQMEGYIAFEGLTRFCTEDYVSPKKRSEVNEDEIMEYGEDNLMGHLTNYCFNKDSDKYVNNQNFQVNDNGSKRLLTSVMKIMEKNGVNIEKFKADVKDLCTKLVYIFQPYLVHCYHKEIGVEGEANQNCFHIFGLDVLLDENHKCWILEINCFPSFSYFFEKVSYNPETKSRLKMKEISKLDKYYQIRIENKIGKKLPQFRIRCLIFFQLYFLFVFDSTSNHCCLKKLFLWCWVNQRNPLEYLKKYFHQKTILTNTLNYQYTIR